MDQQPGNALLHVQLHVDPARAEEHDRWYNEEHLPHWVSLPGFLGGRRFNALEGQDYFQYLTLYELGAAAAAGSDEYWKARENPPPRSKEMGALHSGALRSVFRQIYPEQGALVGTGSGTRVVEGRQPIGRVLLHVMMDRDPELDDEINDWYNAHHLNDLLAMPGFLSARRFEAIEAEHDYLTIYEVESADAFNSPEYKAPRRHQSPRAERGLSPTTFYRSVFQQTFPASGTLEG